MNYSTGSPMFPSHVIDVRKPEGNAWCILGNIQHVMRQIGEPEEEIEKIINDAQSDDYKHLCDVARNFFTIVGEDKIGMEEDEEEDEEYYH